MAMMLSTRFMIVDSVFFCETLRTGLCTVEMCNRSFLHKVMTADLRISIKDYRREETLKVLLRRVPFGVRQYWVWMNGRRWPADGRPVSLTRVMTALRKALVRGTNGVKKGVDKTITLT
jgi:hypothetical protein